VYGRIFKTWDRHNPDASKCDTLNVAEEGLGLAGQHELLTWNLAESGALLTHDTLGMTHDTLGMTHDTLGMFS